MKALIALAALLASTSAFAAAVYKDGNALLESFRAEERVDMGRGGEFDLPNSMEGFGYVLGVFDAVSGQYVCPPNGVSAGQMTQITKNYLMAHPESLQNSAASLVITALSRAYPCK